MKKRVFFITGLAMLLTTAVVIGKPPKPIEIVVMTEQAPSSAPLARQFRSKAILTLASLGFYELCPFTDADLGDQSIKNVFNMFGAECELADASVIVRPFVNASNHFIMSSYFTQQANTKAIDDVDLGDVKSIDNFDTSKLVDGFGRPNIAKDGTLSLGTPPAPAAYQQGIQLVPLGTDAPAYIDELRHMLALRKVVAVDSGITGLTLAGSTPDSTICNAGQQYFAYYVTINTDEKQLLGFTRVGASADGWLFDCYNHQMISDLGTDDKRSVPTALTTAITQYAGIMSALGAFKRWNLTPEFSMAFPLAGNFAQVPSSTDYKHRVGELALQRLVDKLCTAADAIYTPPPLTPAPDAKEKRVSVAGTTTQATAPPLPFPQLTAPTPYHVNCNSGPDNSVHVDVAQNRVSASTQFYGWAPFRAAPAPRPTSSPSGAPPYTITTNPALAAGQLVLTGGQRGTVAFDEPIDNISFVSRPAGCADVIFTNGSSQRVSSLSVTFDTAYDKNTCTIVFSGPNGIVTLDIVRKP